LPGCGATPRFERATRRTLCSLLVGDGGGFCGRGYQGGSRPKFGAPWAFQITLDGCAVGNFTLAHEHGHNMGFSHGPPPDNTGSTGSLRDFAYGLGIDRVARTVMSTSGGRRRGHFSNPEVEFGPPVLPGNFTGAVDCQDNALAGDIVAPFAANWRVRPQRLNLMFSSGFETTETSLGADRLADR